MTRTDSSGARADDHQRIAAEAFTGDRKSAARQRVVDALGQRALADDGELGGGRQRAADQRAEREDEWRFRSQRIAVRRAFVQQQPHAESAAAQELAQRRFIQWHAFDAERRLTSIRRNAPWYPNGIDGYPPASADRIST